MYRTVGIVQNSYVPLHEGYAMDIADNIARYPTSLTPKARPVHIRADPLSANMDPLQACLRQLAAKFDSCLHNAPLSDFEELELYYSVNIHDKIAKEAAMSKPNLHHLVVLCNMNDAITLGQYQLYQKNACTENITTYTASILQASTDHEKECLKGSDRLSVASRQCDKSLRFRIDNIHLNF